MPARRLASTLLLLLASAGAPIACEARTTGDAPLRAAVAEGAGAGELAQRPGYVVDVELPTETNRGQQAIAHVRVHPTAPWHMNLEYPAKLHLRAPADVELMAPVLRKDDAQRYDDQALEFSVLFTPRARGPRKIQAELDFAVCGDASCGPVTESLELAFDVGCRNGDSGLC